MIAVDTNVLIYACDQADPRRQKIALDLIDAVSAEDARYGAIFWVAPKDVKKTSALLGAL